MPVEQIVDVPESGELILQLPQWLKGSKKVKVVIDEVDEDYEAKVALLRQAPSNKDFMADLYEVHKDFEGAEGPIE